MLQRIAVENINSVTQKFELSISSNVQLKFARSWEFML